MCLSLPHPLILVKTLEHLLEEREGGKKNPTKNCSIYADIKKKNKWQIIFQKKPKKTPLFLANKLPSLWEAALHRSAPACWEDKSLSRRGSGAGGGRERRELGVRCGAQA